MENVLTNKDHILALAFIWMDRKTIKPLTIASHDLNRVPPKYKPKVLLLD
jgi:hypothetical protein